MSVKRTQSTVEKYYLKYEYLASQYANQVFDFEKCGYDKQDILQEMKIKIYTSIVAYAKKWKEYRTTGRYKPVHIQIYIQAALVHRVRDFIKELNSQKIDSASKLSIQHDAFDCGIQQMFDSEVDINRCVCIINGVDIFANLGRMESRCFALYLKGFSLSKLKQMFKKTIDAEFTVSQQIERLRASKDELMQFEVRYFENYQLEEVD